MGETTAVCPHCEAYLLEWDPVRGRLGPAPAPPAPRPGSADPAAVRRVGRTVTTPSPLDTHRSLTVFRWLCGIAMALHGLLVLAQLVEPSLMLLGWVVLWLPLDAFWRSTRR